MHSVWGQSRIKGWTGKDSFSLPVWAGTAVFLLPSDSDLDSKLHHQLSWFSDLWTRLELYHWLFWVSSLPAGGPGPLSLCNSVSQILIVSLFLEIHKYPIGSVSLENPEHTGASLTPCWWSVCDPWSSSRGTYLRPRDKKEEITGIHCSWPVLPQAQPAAHNPGRCPCRWPLPSNVSNHYGSQIQLSQPSPQPSKVFG